MASDKPLPAAAAADENLDPAKKAKKSTRPSKLQKSKFTFFSDAVTADILDDRTEQARMRRIVHIVRMQGVAIFILVMILLGEIAFPHILYNYYALSSDRKVMALVPLIMPNVTNQAVTSWATDGITEIMTFGFGDYQTHLRDQRIRFTSDGWKSFSGTFDKMKIGEAFRQRQLVLTTVPSDIATIESQGPNRDHVYEWHVQMPIIMTYTTNDNVARHDNARISLTIVRVPSSESPAGIAIQGWRMEQ